MINNNKGIAIFVSLALLFLLSAAAIAVLLTAYNYNSICEGQIKRMKAIASAEAGVNYAYYQLRTDAAAFVSEHNSEAAADTIVPGSNGISVKVWATGPILGRYTVNSKASYLKVSAP
jgi:Tfp pilus assembly protein PilX